MCRGCRIPSDAPVDTQNGNEYTLRLELKEKGTRRGVPAGVGYRDRLTRVRPADDRGGYKEAAAVPSGGCLGYRKRSRRYSPGQPRYPLEPPWRSDRGTARVSGVTVLTMGYCMPPPVEGYCPGPRNTVRFRQRTACRRLRYPVEDCRGTAWDWYRITFDRHCTSSDRWCTARGSYVTAWFDRSRFVWTSRSTVQVRRATAGD